MVKDEFMALLLRSLYTFVRTILGKFQPYIFFLVVLVYISPICRVFLVLKDYLFVIVLYYSPPKIGACSRESGIKLYRIK